MKTLKIVLMLMLIVNAASAQSKEEQEVLNLSKNKFRWMTQMKFDSLTAVLDDRLMFVHSNGWTETKEEFINDIQSGKLRYTDISVEEASARLFGQTAVIIGKGKFRVVLEGSELDIKLYYTEVYIRNGKSWLLVSRHANRLQ